MSNSGDLFWRLVHDIHGLMHVCSACVRSGMVQRTAKRARFPGFSTCRGGLPALAGVILVTEAGLRWRASHSI